MILPGDESAYRAARDAIDEAVKEYSPRVNENLQILARLRARKENLNINSWLRSVDSLDVQRAGYLVDLAGANRRLVKAYMFYFRLAFNFRFSLKMAQNINFRKIISFEYFAFDTCKVFQVSDSFHRPSLSTVKQDVKLFYLSPQAHFFAWRLLQEYYVRINLGDTQRIEILNRVYMRVIMAFEKFYGETAHGISPDSLRNFIELRDNADILQLVDHIDGKYPAS